MRPIATYMLLAGLFACTDPQPALTGTFGGENVQLTATAQRTDVALACSGIQAGPLLYADGRDAHASGEMHFFSIQRAPVPATIDAHRIDATYVELTLHIQDSPPTHVIVGRGIPAHYTFACLTTSAS
jgi:hypothetical protein